MPNYHEQRLLSLLVKRLGDLGRSLVQESKLAAVHLLDSCIRSHPRISQPLELAGAPAAEKSLTSWGVKAVQPSLPR